MADRTRVVKEVRSEENRAGGREVKIWVLLAITFFAGTTLLAQDLPRGQVVPRVACTAAPAFSYALYLPSNYTPERRWPVVFCFDPAGAGERPVHLLEKAAEAYGYILM